MTLESEITIMARLLKAAIANSAKATMRWVSATEINWSEGTMTAEDASGVPYYNVLLGVGTMQVKPKQNTDCLIAVVEGNETLAIMLFAEETEELAYNADKIVFNGGENGGMPIVEKLSDNLKSLKDFVEAIHKSLPAAFSAVGVGAAANGGTAALKYQTALAGKTIQLSDFENKKIQH